MSKPILTVFTPTYNRADLLIRGYNALCRQSCHDFVWLIIDDGSNDNTNNLVQSWIESSTRFLDENGFHGYSKDAKWLQILYCYKENGGLHTGYNKAIELMDSEICVCIDSDDFMPDDAVEIIKTKWEKYNNGKISGLVGLDFKLNGMPIGTGFPEGKVTHYIKLKEDKRYNFDNKIVMRVDFLKKIAPQPTFAGERNFNPIWMILKIDEIAPFVLINDNLCYVEYQDGGMSYNLINQYFNSPNSFLELRKLYVSLKNASIWFRLKNYVHLVAQSKIAHKSAIQESPNKLIAIIFYPIGILLYRYMLLSHKNFNKK